MNREAGLLRKLKSTMLLIVLLTGVVLVQQNFAIITTTTDADADVESIGTCHLRNQKNKTLLFDGQEIDGADGFRFVIENREVAKVQPILSNEQLIDLKHQLVVSNDLYQQVLGLSAPLSQQRYQDANYISVAMASIKGNGLAYDEVTADKALGLTDCRINMKLSATLKASNSTPAHELFHLYQNSYFMFKNKWLTEGTARWSESLIDKGVGKKIGSRLPQSRNELVETMEMSYAASAMWARLFQLVDSRDVFDIPDTLKNARYLDGSRVIDDNKAYGTSFIKVLFETLEEQSGQASNDRGWNTYNWKEKEQKSADNNVYIWQAIQDAVNRAVPKEQQSEELRRFMSISLSSP